MIVLANHAGSPTADCQDLRAAAVPVLVYHRILSAEGAGDRVARVPGVSAADFARQIAYLAEAGYTTVSLRDLTEGGAEPGRPIVLTFDDGWSSSLTQALPILAPHGFTATAFITTDPEASVFDPAREVDPPLRPTEWLALAEAGWEIGSHTHTHPPLVECAADRLREELSRSRAELESATGRTIGSLATPFGLSSARVEAAARECGYTRLCPGLAGVCRWGNDPFAVRRMGVPSRFEPGAFRRLLTPWGAAAIRMGGTLKTLVRRAIGHQNSMRLREAVLRARTRGGGGP